jgi:hypothetical protein
VAVKGIEMADESTATPAEGSIAKASGGQPELDVDALMQSVEKHNAVAKPAKAKGDKSSTASDSAK